MPGGRLNAASADYTFAGGRRARAAAQGAFVWADSQDADFTSSIADEFKVRSQGGFYIDSSSASFGLGGARSTFTVTGDLELKGAITRLRDSALGQTVSATNWNDLTDGGATTRHTHAGKGSHWTRASGLIYSNTIADRLAVGRTDLTGGCCSCPRTQRPCRRFTRGRLDLNHRPDGAESA